MGIKDGILEKKNVYDDELVAKAYLEGFNRGINRARAVGQLT